MQRLVQLFLITWLGNGYIPTSCLREILSALDDNLTSEQLDGIIAEIDTDGSGTVDFDGTFMISAPIEASAGRQPPIQSIASRSIHFRFHWLPIVGKKKKKNDCYFGVDWSCDNVEWDVGDGRSIWQRRWIDDDGWPH